MTKELGNRVISLRQSIVNANFKRSHWHELGLLTGQSKTIEMYPRLLRSLSWKDPDYTDNVLGVLRQIRALGTGTLYLTAGTPLIAKELSF